MTASLEQFANVPQTTLNGNISAGATSLVVASASGFSTVGNFRIVIDNEIFIVTAISGTTFTVTPGAEGTTQANHTSGATITQVLTAQGLVAGLQKGPVEPGGRLTLTSNTPIQLVDKTAQTTVYYCGFAHNWVPNWNGTSWLAYPLDTQLSLSLDSNSGHTGYQVSGSLFDIFATLNAGSLILCTGPAWTNSTTRSAGIALLNGIWTNSGSMTAKIDATSSTITVAANQGTYLGTIYATANGQTGMALNPAAASGGSANILGLYNGYNQVPIIARSRDSATSYTYATNTWQKANNNANNSISWVDGLGTVYVDASYKTAAGNATSADFFEIGINLNSTSATPDTFAYDVSGTTTLANTYKTATTISKFYPTLGFNYIQAMENNSAVTTTYNPVAGIQCLTANLVM